MTPEDLCRFLEEHEIGNGPPESGYGNVVREALVGPFRVNEVIEYKWGTKHRILVNIVLPMLERLRCRGHVFSMEQKARVGDVDELRVLQDAVDFMEGIDPEEFFRVGDQLRGLREWGPRSGIPSSLERVSGDDDLV